MISLRTVAVSFQDLSQSATPAPSPAPTKASNKNLWDYFKEGVAVGRREVLINEILNKVKY